MYSSLDMAKLKGRGIDAVSSYKHNDIIGRSLDYTPD
jgi:hypothetical protein